MEGDRSLRRLDLSGDGDLFSDLSLGFELPSACSVSSSFCFQPLRKPAKISYAETPRTEFVHVRTLGILPASADRRLVPSCALGCTLGALGCALGCGGFGFRVSCADCHAPSSRFRFWNSASPRPREPRCIWFLGSLMICVCYLIRGSSFGSVFPTNGDKANATVMHFKKFKGPPVA